MEFGSIFPTLYLGITFSFTVHSLPGKLRCNQQFITTFSTLEKKARGMKENDTTEYDSEKVTGKYITWGNIYLYLY